jgi:hypothetical protein
MRQAHWQEYGGEENTKAIVIPIASNERAKARLTNGRAAWDRK